MGEVDLCLRCGRAAPGDAGDAVLFWKAWDEIGDAVICPECITADELAAMVQGDMLEVHESEVSGHLIGEEIDTFRGPAPEPCRRHR